ncbi:flagellar biosynthesis protein FlhF [Alteromonadaceae bacterium Bs31]|nr:flagellar biosynthesis protein FlhF [Alteromonadaceae bacterium Bs31]
MHPTGNNLVKRFVAPSMRRALDLVREELGPEAVILSSQKVPGGVEVVTSLEPDLPTRGIDVRREFGRNFDAELDRAMPSDSAWQMQAGVDQAAAQYSGRVELNEPGQPAKRGEQLAREIERARERMMDAKRRAKEGEQPISQLAEAPAPRPEPTAEHKAHKQEERAQSYAPEQQSTHSQAAAVDEARLDSLQSELADMRMLLEQQFWRMSKSEEPVSMPQQINMPVSFSVLNEHMNRLGLPSEIAQRLLSEAGPSNKVSTSWRNCMARLAKNIPVEQQDMLGKGGIFAFVGQTGVGKTTTIAKLAARYVLDHGPGKVALVTTDTYRVGAYDQLRSLGRILNVPVRAVDSENSLITVLAKLRQFPLILIDTAGFRHGDPLLKDQLRKLDSCPGLKRILVMACNSQQQTMKASTHAYKSSSGIDACVLTKLDEAASLGEAIGVVLERGIPVAYTTDGQEIPKDIKRASGHQMVAAAVALMKSGGHAEMEKNSI